jgi:hypothetical protein
VDASVADKRDERAAAWRSWVTGLPSLSGFRLVGITPGEVGGAMREIYHR